jgi:hypothetical protein
VNDIARPPHRPISAARILYVAIRVVIVLALSFGAFVLSVVASVWGLTAVLVGAALIVLVVLRVVQTVRAKETAVIARPRRAFVITGVVVIGFFVLLTVASQIWVTH